MLFRAGFPTHVPERRSLRRRVPGRRPARDPELTRRNQPAISPTEQSALASLRVLVAGCGSIGGAAVEPLARLGVGDFVLAEPGTYEANNLNRQTALRADLGRNKADVLAERVLAIDPTASALVEPTGVTPTNVEWLVGTTDVVVDGVDVTETQGIVAKRLLHAEAWRQRRLVISGLDLGGTQLVYVFDYRDGHTRPFDGRLDGAGEHMSALDFLSRLVGPTDVPREMLTYVEAVVRGESGSAPQLAPTANQFGVLAAWAILDFAAGRPLRSFVRVDIPALLMPLHRRAWDTVARLVQVLRIKLQLEVKRVHHGL
jgi:molybdopterin/thiamine biosynthesis adenylyltransferase